MIDRLIDPSDPGVKEAIEAAMRFRGIVFRCGLEDGMFAGVAVLTPDEVHAREGGCLEDCG
ncbi:MAG TPA: hypothetical protein VEU47_19135 [Candidatus Cybelea sp.]|nr:hypothetical protein [Candidatus Cybelea sp.]